MLAERAPSASSPGRRSSLRRTLELEPKHPHSHAELAWLLLEQGQTEQAVREYLTHLSLSPSRERVCRGR